MRETTTPEAEALLAQLRNVLEMRAAKLKPNRSAIGEIMYELHAGRGMSYAEVGAIVGLPKQAVHSRIGRLTPADKDAQRYAKRRTSDLKRRLATLVDQAGQRNEAPSGKGWTPKVADVSKLDAEAAKLVARLKAHGMATTKVAEAVGVSRSTLGRIIGWTL